MSWFRRKGSRPPCGPARAWGVPMRSALPLLIAGGSLALLPLLAPATTVVPGGLERVSNCATRQEHAPAPALDWMGSLQGWQDSALVMIWRGSLAWAKGRSHALGCAGADQMEP
jgi:hypothetical protein